MKCNCYSETCMVDDHADWCLVNSFKGVVIPETIQEVLVGLKHRIKTVKGVLEVKGLSELTVLDYKSKLDELESIVVWIRGE